ncbi:MAG: glycoside hydrolase family 88 protein [Chloroflexi bacterium]|nr:glycoside hydrolase family 88 protein [Chloroflexota bacterium]
MSSLKSLKTHFDRVKCNISLFGDLFPVYGNGSRYVLQPNDQWLAGFWPGLLWLTYNRTHDDSLADSARATLTSFADRLKQRIHITHDLGFLYSLSARAQWQCTGDPAARQLALEAADLLAERYHPNGKYIQAWGAIGAADEGGRIIIDTMMNLPLLFWAADQTGRRELHTFARDHAETTAYTLLRDDGSTYHTYFFDQNTGKPVGPKTHQGFADDSLWARGQAWAIFGFATAAQWTGSNTFVDAARSAAERFLIELPPDGIPTWDLRLPADAPHHPDTSASAIAAAGLLRLAPQVSSEEAARLRTSATRLLDSLNARFVETDPDAQGLLRGGTYHAHKNLGVNEYFICGDYYFLVLQPQIVW